MDRDAVCDGCADVDEEYEEYEVEEMADDVPMHITGRLFLGSIDAAHNGSALSKARIAFTLALLGAGDHGDGIAAVFSPAGAHNTAQQQHSASEEAAVIKRTEFAIEDALDESLFRKLPVILTTLDGILCVSLLCLLLPAIAVTTASTLALQIAFQIGP